MKKRLFIYIIAFLSFILTGFLVFSFINVAKAGESEVHLKIVGYNLSFEDSVKIEYAILTEGVKDYDKIIVRTYESMQDYYDDKGYTLEYLGNRKINGIDYSIYIDKHVAAKQMTTDFYTYATYDYGDGSYSCSDVVKYSVLQYVKNMYGTNKSDAKFDELLESMLEYGAASQKYFNYKLDRLANDTYYEIKLIDGYINSLETSGLFKLNEEVTIEAAYPDFIYWENVDTGEIYSYNKKITLNVNSDLRLKAIDEIQGSEYLAYSLIENTNEYEVVGIGNCTDTDIVIPKLYNGKVISRIKENAFKDCTNLESITLQYGIEEIGDYAFSGCTSLQIVKLSNSVNKIGIHTFNNCTSLDTIVLPMSLNVASGEYFTTCNSLENLYFIGPILFIEDNINIDGYNCFLYSDEYTDDMITDNNFYWHYVDNEVVIWDKETNDLSFIKENGECTVYLTRQIYDEVIYIPSFHEGLPVTKIGTLFISDCPKCESVYIGKNVKVIESCAFSDSDTLKYVYMSDSVTTIGLRTFNNSTKLKNVKLSKSLTKLEGLLFMDCSSLTSIDIPDGITSIPSNCFKNCNSLEYIVLPESIAYVADFAFYNCEKLSKIYYKGTPESILNVTIEMCNDPLNQKNIYYYNDEYNYEPGNYWCYDGNDIKILRDDRFTFRKCQDFEYDCYILTDIRDDYYGDIIVPSTYDDLPVIGIDIYAFNMNSNITSVFISEGIIQISDSSFKACTSLSYVYLPSTIIHISDSAFNNCTNLEYIYYNGTPTDFANVYIGDDQIDNFDSVICYYSESLPSDTNHNYWHFVNDKPVLWAIPDTDIE